MQSRRHSFLEALAGTAIGMVISVLLGLVVYPLFGHAFTLQQNVGIMLIFTVVSVVRSYLVRRGFNALHHWPEMKGSPKPSVRVLIEMMSCDGDELTLLYGLDDALVGIIPGPDGSLRAVYDEDAMLRIFMARDGMSEESAAGFLELNVRTLCGAGKGDAVLMSVLNADYSQKGA